MKGLKRLLAVAGVGYGAYRWLRGRPKTMARIKDAVRNVREAARKGDIGEARTALTGLGEAIGDDPTLRRAADRVRKVVSQVGNQVRDAISTTLSPVIGTMTPLQVDADTAATILPICGTLVQAGRLAEERGSIQEIRQLGNRLAVQFDQIGAQLREFGPEVPQGLDDAGERLISNLSDLAGHPFDVAFVDESMNAVIRLLDVLPEQSGDLGVQMRSLEGEIRDVADNLHQRSGVLPGPGTTEGIETDRGAA